MHDHNEDYKIGRHGAKVGIVTNVLLFFLKLYAGIFGKSHAMIADSLHTATDALTSIGVFVGFKIAQKPADEEHPYGHGRAESIAAKLVSIILIMGGMKVGFDAVMIIINRDLHVPHQMALWAAVISIVIKEALYRYTNKMGDKIQSNALKADAWHHRSDALSSIAAFIGILGAMMGYPIMDPVAAATVSIFVIKAGLGIFHTAYDELMDAALPENILRRIKELTMTVDGVKRIKDVKGRKMGIDIFVDLTIEVDSDMRVSDAHTITAKIRRSVLKNLQGAKDIFIHVEPY